MRGDRRHCFVSSGLGVVSSSTVGSTTPLFDPRNLGRLAALPGSVRRVVLNMQYDQRMKNARRRRSDR
jgi:hypothetical protein